jgi:hypothetical protein
MFKVIKHNNQTKQLRFMNTWVKLMTTLNNLHSLVCQGGVWGREGTWPPHLETNILTFTHFLNQDENFFIPQTAANMLINATDFKLPS